jgi:hypothetical protein
MSFHDQQQTASGEIFLEAGYPVPFCILPKGCLCAKWRRGISLVLADE